MASEFNDLTPRLFAAAAAMLEDSIAAAVAGQSPKMRRTARTSCALQLHVAIRDIASVADALVAITRFEATAQYSRRRSRR